MTLVEKFEEQQQRREPGRMVRLWLAEIGRRGGQVTSPAKREAARANGQLGGRPSKRAGGER